MKEQVIASRAPRRAAVKGKGFVQRPARRDGRGIETRSFSLGPLFAYLPKALKVMLAILFVITLVVGYRVASSASMFQVRTIDVVGTSRTSAEEIEGLARRAVARTGVWRANLPALSAELGRLPGVRRAVVSRVLPDGLRVRVTERVPIAVVRTSGGHFVWVDEEGVGLGEMKTGEQLPPFFIHGWNEDGTAEAGKENSERVRKYLEAVREWQAIGIAERVSEITLFDVHDVRAQLSGNDSQIEVRLGAEGLSRLKMGLDVLDEYKQTPRGADITYIDVQTDRVIVGTSSGNKLSAATGDSDTTANQVAAEAMTASTSAAAAADKHPVADRKKAARESSADKRNKEVRPRVR
jgi:cell division protein FtsQ